MGYEFYPESIGHVLIKVQQSFSNQLIVTENGIGTDDDHKRSVFIQRAISSIKNAVDNGMTLKGYF